MSSLIASHPHQAANGGDQAASLGLVAVWLGLLTGLVEAAIVGGLRYAPLRYALVSPDIVWMAPAVDVSIFLVTAAVIVATQRVWPRMGSRHAGILVLAFLAFFSVAYVFHPELHKYAGMLLAAGLAVQTARLIAAHPAGFRRLANRTVRWMMVLIAVSSVTVHAWQLWAQRRALAALPLATPGSPNVLLIVLDTVRAQNMSLYRYPRPTTPHLERLASAGVLFHRAFSTAPWTLPSHASLFTGRYPHELSADWRTPLDATYPTLAEVLSRRGYVSAGFVANVAYCSYKNGLARGFAHYEDYGVTPGQIILSASLGRYVTESERLRDLVGYYQTLGRKNAADINNAVVRWLSRDRARPFFVFLNYLDAHNPYLPPPPFDRQFGSRPMGAWNLWARPEKTPPQKIRAMINGYDGSIAYLDQQLGFLFDELRTRRLLENTLVIVTADHGEEFGEHRTFNHGNSLYLPSLHVPLLIIFPGHVPAGMHVKEPVTLRDLPATIIDLLGQKSEPDFPGTLLARHWEPVGRGGPQESSILLAEVNWDERVPAWVPLSRGNMKSVVTNQWHYILNGDGREELYDFDEDPAEAHDRAAAADARQALESSRNTLRRRLVAGDPSGH